MNEKEVKKLSSLRIKKYRDKHREFLIEGFRLTREALSAGTDLTALYCSESARDDLEKASAFRHVPVEIIQDKQLQRISDTVTPSGIIGVCAIPETDIESIPKNENCIFLDSLNDPGNLGTIVRTSAWFGIHQIVLSENSADPYNPKAVRGGMGAHFYTTFYPNISAEWLQSCGKKILVADTGGDPIDAIENIPEPWILVMGSEASGVSENILSIDHQKMSIPKFGKGESLNVAVAAGIIISSLAKS